MGLLAIFFAWWRIQHPVHCCTFALHSLLLAIQNATDYCTNRNLAHKKAHQIHHAIESNKPTFRKSDLRF